MTNDISSLPVSEDLPKSWQDAQRRAEALWPQIAQDMDWPVEGVTFRRMTVNSAAENHRCVLLVHVPEHADVVLRADFKTTGYEYFRQVVQRMRSLATNIGEVPDCTIPQVLWQHCERRFVVMELCGGSTLYEELNYCDLGFGDRSATLQRAGRAVRALHDASPREMQQFWPKQCMSTVAERAALVRSGELEIRRQPKFLGLCAYLHRRAREVRGCNFMSAYEHGDLHMRNILVSEETVSFIDFANTRSQNPLRDLAYLWLANCPDHLARGDQRSGFGGVAADDWDAFSKGYGVDLIKDPLFRFCFAYELWTIWQRLPAPDQIPSGSEKRREAGILKVFNALLEGETD